MQGDSQSPTSVEPERNPLGEGGAPADPFDIDRAVCSVWMAGAAHETERLQRSLKARLQEVGGRKGAIANTNTECSRIDADAVVSPVVNPAAGSVAHPHSARTRLMVWTPWYSGRATLVVLASLISAWFGGHWRAGAAMANQTSVYATANGERAVVILPDGSTVTLNVASRLEVPASYGAGNRTVRLTGAGLFTVVHQPNAPFTVAAGATTVRVLGTTFVVRAYGADTAATVAVRDGKVVVQSQVLTANQKAIVDDDGGVIVTAATVGQFTFANNVLTLDGQRLIEAIPELNRWYNADLRLGDRRLDTRRVGGQFAAGSVNDLAEILRMTLGVRVERHGKILTLYGR